MRLNWKKTTGEEGGMLLTVEGYFEAGALAARKRFMTAYALDSNIVRHWQHGCCWLSALAVCGRKVAFVIIGEKMMKRMVVQAAGLALVALAVLSCSPEHQGPWDGSIAKGFAGGRGGVTDPYRINVAAQLAYLAREVNDGTNYAGAYFILTRDLDLGGHEWTAIGTYTNRFKGNFDGDGHVISGLFIDQADTDFQGLFGYLDGGGVSNLGLEDLAIQGKQWVGGIAGKVISGGIENCYSAGTVSGTGNAGGIAGYVDRDSGIENCYSTGTVSGTGAYVGGIAGYVWTGGSIENCYSTGEVSGTDDCVGGIAGSVWTGGSVENCYSTGAVSGISKAGGIAGSVYHGSIENCYNTGMVSGTNGYVGGIAGVVNGSGIRGSYSTGAVSGISKAGGIAGSVSGGSVDNSYSTGEVSGTSYIGGIAGDVGGGIGIAGGVWTSGSVENCYSTGAVSGGGYNIGGIAGHVGSSSGIDNCYSTGEVSGTEKVGGIAGSAENSSGIDNCYSAGKVSGIGNYAGGIAGSIENSSGIENCYSTGTVSGSLWVGGIAGSVIKNSGIKNCASLNLTVTASRDYAGRIAGSIVVGGNTFTGNVAWDEMSNIGGAAFNTNAGNHGIDISTDDVQDGTGLPSSLTSNPWIYTTGRRPILKDLAGQDDLLPGYLAPFGG
jgi:hypothetical protein